MVLYPTEGRDTSIPLFGALDPKIITSTRFSSGSIYTPEHFGAVVEFLADKSCETNQQSILLSMLI